MNPLFSIHAPGYSMAWLAIFNNEDGGNVLATFGDLETENEIENGGDGKGGSVFIWKIEELPASIFTIKNHSILSRECVNTPGPAILDWSSDDESRLEFADIPCYTSSACELRVQYAADERIESMFFYKSVVTVLYSSGTVTLWDVNKPEEELKNILADNINLNSVRICLN
jgi:WD40 repeat protein